MGWNPDERQENEMKIMIKQKWRTLDLKDSSVEGAISDLKKARTKAQAHAVIREVKDFGHIKLLADTEFEGITDNSKETILKAVEDAPKAIQQAQLQAEEDQRRAEALRERARVAAQLNQRINGYYNTLNQRDLDEHHAGRFDRLPLPKYEMVDNRPTVIAQVYHNVERRLPVGGQNHYVEWYPLAAGGARSLDKRFFTKAFTQDLWYTEGGTHGQNALWYRFNPQTGDWMQMG